jgi:fructose-1,6-bisphosphatase/inositol monophosphatase family enzyme
VATTPAEVRASAELLGLAPAALALSLVDPGVRLLVAEPGIGVLLRREWLGDGTAEALVARRSGGAVRDEPAVFSTAAAWGCEWVRHAATGRTVPVPLPGPEAPLVERFLHLAALAATRVEVAVALARGAGHDTVKADGSPSLAADEAAHTAAVAVLGGLGVTVLSEERTDQRVADDEPWVVLDPLDGTGNFRAGLPPWAFSAALVSGGVPVAGVVVDLSSGRRWIGAPGRGAWRDGVPVRVQSGPTVMVPTAPPGQGVLVPPTAKRVRVTGCTAADLCLVADGSAGAWHDLDRSGTHVHDVAGGLALLLAAGGAVLDADGGPLRLRPDTEALIRFVAAATPEDAERLRRVFV